MSVTSPVFRHEFTALAARCTLALFDVAPEDGRVVAQRIERRVADIATRYGLAARDSWLNRVVNERRGAVVDLDDEAARLFAAVHAHARDTDGAFDITQATYASALRRARSTWDAVAVRRRLAPFTGLDRWRVEGGQLRFDNMATRVDLGGVLRAFALDEAAALARAAGVCAGELRHGVDALAFGAAPAGRRCLAVIPDPLDAQRAAAAVDLDGQALAIATPANRRLARRADDPAQHGVADPDAPRWLLAGVVSCSALASAVHAHALLADAGAPLPAGMHAVTVGADGRVHRLGERVPA